MQAEIRAIAKRYDMAVMGPNSEGFANTANNLCPTFSPAMEAGDRPLLPAGRPRGQLAVMAQSGGIGFAFFDHGRARELSFRYIVTTGNEACLEVLDFADFILDEGKTDALLLLLEDIKSPETFRRVAEKALRAGKPLIVNKIGQSQAGVRAAASHTAALAGEYAAYQAMFQRYGLIEGRDLGEMVDFAAGFLAWGSRLPLGRRVGICTASGGGGGWMADACIAAGLEVPELDSETRRRIDEHLPAYGTSQNPVDATAQAAAKIGYAGLAGLVVPSPAVDGLIVVMTGRNPHNLERQKEALARLAAETPKPILMWSYTLPAPRSVEILSEAGYPLYTGIQTCARTMRAMADYRALRERFLRPIEVTSRFAPDKAGARLRWRRQTRCFANGRRGRSWRATASAPIRSVRWQAPPRKPSRRQRRSAAPSRSRCSRRISCTRRKPGPWRSAFVRPRRCARPTRACLPARKRHAPAARILGVLVQPMAPPGREVILGVKRDATFGPLLMVGLGGVHVEILKDVALAPVPLAPRRGARAARPPEGRSPARRPPRRAARRRRRARRADGAPLPASPPTTPTQSPRSTSTPCWCMRGARAYRWSMR